MDKIFFSIRETNRMTGLGETFLRRGVKDGSIPHLQIGRKCLINLPLLLDQVDELCRIRTERAS